ncbi:MAG TPA: hypothetical protein VN966_03385, partial [Candidatus Bathyarchaeia archaeon]|nr:hypothetical protein [Candidatus Bathyarchaeia archaeon]
MSENVIIVCDKSGCTIEHAKVGSYYLEIKACIKGDGGVGAILRFMSLLFLFFLPQSPPAFGQSASVIEEARKEGGKVVAYGSLESEAF